MLKQNYWAQITGSLLQIPLEKLVESMTGQLDQDWFLKGVQNAQERLAEIDDGKVQTIPGEVGLAQVRQLIQT
ncbi:MAG: addiction module protein [Synechococcaceae cyanobacterium SM2_3_1]|nr:addiction module protein [Synechococcaceae cyanobacterium SM2_3_1]